MTLDLAIIIPVKNEELNLAECLERIGDLGTVFVVDSKSTDRTVAVAKTHKAEVIQFNWNGRFPKKKNWVLSTGLIKSDWVLFLDADEYVTDEFKKELSAVLPETEHNGFWLTFQNHFLGKPMRHGIPFRKLFLVRTGFGQFQRVEDEGWTSLDMEVHEQIEVEGTVGTIKAPIIHQNYKGFEHFLAKHNEYSTWEAKRFLAGAETFRPSLRQKVKRAFIDSYMLSPIYFITNYFLRLGFLDGKAGLLYSVFKAFYFLEVKVKIDELRRKERTSRE